jgi:hypothetical protein
MSELEPANLTVVPVLGTVVNVDNPTHVAETIADVDQAVELLREMRDMLVGLVVDEASRQGTKTLHLEDGIIAKVSGGSRPEYDLETLADQLRDAGLPEDRLEQLIVPRVEYKLDQAVARQLRGANPAYRQALDECRTDVPAPWRVTVERKEKT